MKAELLILFLPAAILAVLMITLPRKALKIAVPVLGIGLFLVWFLLALGGGRSTMGLGPVLVLVTAAIACVALALRWLFTAVTRQKEGAQ